MKIYTKTGDFGTTSLFGGDRIDKSSRRIEAYGDVDELNSMIGVILADLINYSSSESNLARRVEKSKLGSSRQAPPLAGQARTIINKLLRIQFELFVLGSDLATPNEVKVKVPRIPKPYIARLEKEIDQWTASLPQLRNFILPGGSKIGSKLHLARTTARRAERSIVDLANTEKINKNALVYINRLSDWLFTLARYVNKIEGISEKTWKGRG